MAFHYRPERCLLIERLPLPVGPWLSWPATVAITALAILLRYLADTMLLGGFPFVTLFPAIILCAVLFGPLHGTAAGVLSGFASWYLFLTPARTLATGPGALTAMGLFFIVVASIVLLVGWLQRANRHLAEERERSARLADTRALLFRELQHRVSNNLQAVAALLVLQQRRLADPQAGAALAEAAERVALVGRISRRLYEGDVEHKGLAAFLSGLLDDIVEAHGATDIARRVDCPGDLVLGADHALPMALVMGESIANAIEHGLPDHPAPAIAIVAANDDAGLRIDVIDNGGRLPAGFRAEACDSMGLSIASMLARQVGGHYELTGGDETRASLTLPYAAVQVR